MSRITSGAATLTARASGSRRARAIRAGVRIVGAGLLVGTAWIHYHLYDLGYSSVPTIGPLFMLNAVAGLILAAALLVVPRRLLAFTALLGGGFQIVTLAALLLSLTVGLFGFTETMDAPLIWPTIFVEGAGGLLLLAYALADGRHQLSGLRERRRRSG